MQSCYVITYHYTINYITRQIVIEILCYCKNMGQKTFKDRLTDELNYQGISNKEFASKVGIGIGTLGMYLYRGSIPAADIAVKMAQVLNTTTEHLILGTDNKEAVHPQNTKSDWQKKEINIIIERLPPEQLENFLEIARAFKKSVDTLK